MTIKHWVRDALQHLEESLGTIPHEINEIDWKLELTPNRDRTREHLIALANYAGGGFLAFGVSKSGEPLGITAPAAEQITNTLSSIGRDAVDPPLALDHTVVESRGTSLLLVYAPEQSVKPVHVRGKGIEMPSAI
jgi:ATP-dependent DNA helicase RecG